MLIQTKEELVDELNRRVYTIYIKKLMDLLIKYRTEKAMLECIINNSFKIDLDFKDREWRSAVKKVLGVKNLKKGYFRKIVYRYFKSFN